MHPRNGLPARARHWLLGGALAAAVLAVPALITSPIASAAAPAAAAQGSSTLEDQTELAITVYNSNIALVRDVRTLQLPRGTFDLHGGVRRRILIPKGFVYDGASVPRLVWTLSGILPDGLIRAAAESSRLHRRLVQLSPAAVVEPSLAA